MYLQGDLQNVFDALYHLGVIDPVLEKNWENEMKTFPRFFNEVAKAITVANRAQPSLDTLISGLSQFDQQVLEFLAMEVAREYAEFHTRHQLH